MKRKSPNAGEGDSWGRGFRRKIFPLQVAGYQLGTEKDCQIGIA
jgi:hypothetical protein